MCTIDTVNWEEQVYLTMRVEEISRVKQLHSRYIYIYLSYCSS
jgi:hypothetical protein